MAHIRVPKGTFFIFRARPRNPSTRSGAQDVEDDDRRRNGGAGPAGPGRDDICSAIRAARFCRSMTRCSTRRQIQHVLVRHEQGAAHAAEGYARSTGKVGCLLVTSGPGATNAVTGLTDALMDSIPLVCITGQVPTHLIGSDAFQECDTVGITRHCTKHNYLVRKHRGPAAHPARGLLHRALGPSRPGGDRHSQGRAIRLRRLSAAEEHPAQDLPAADSRAISARSSRRVAMMAKAQQADFLYRRRRHQRRAGGLDACCANWWR